MGLDLRILGLSVPAWLLVALEKEAMPLLRASHCPDTPLHSQPLQ